MSLEEALQILTQTHTWMLWLLLFSSALLEYLFPPFPGDAITVGGAVLVTAYDAPLLTVFSAVMTGSLLGCAADYWLGFLASRYPWPFSQRSAVMRRIREGVERASKAFARYGEVVIVVNRFLPGIRPFLFIAAGIARMRFWLILLYASISAMLWNTLLVALGAALGREIETIQRFYTTYQVVIWVILASLIVFFVFKNLAQKGKRSD